MKKLFASEVDSDFFSVTVDNKFSEIVSAVGAMLMEPAVQSFNRQDYLHEIEFNVLFSPRATEDERLNFVYRLENLG